MFVGQLQCSFAFQLKAGVKRCQNALSFIINNLLLPKGSQCLHTRSGILLEVH